MVSKAIISATLLLCLLGVGHAASIINEVGSMAVQTHQLTNEVDKILQDAEHEVQLNTPSAPPRHSQPAVLDHTGIFLEESATKPSALVEADGQVIAQNPKQSQSKPVSIIDNKIEAIVGASVKLTGSDYEHAEENMDQSSGVVPAVDPQTQHMIDNFNEKYGVYDTLGVENKNVKEYVPKDLVDSVHPENHKVFDDDIVRDYKSVYAGANKWHFDPNLDNPTALDSMLGSMWSKRWEYFSKEKSNADVRNSKELIHRITPVFTEVYNEPSHDSSIGKIFTYANDKDKIVGHHVPNRENFAPKNYWYGPNVIDTAVDVTGSKSEHGDDPSNPPKPGVPSFVYAQYKEGSNKSGPVEIESIQVTGRSSSNVVGVGKVEHLATPYLVPAGQPLQFGRKAFIMRKRANV